MALSSEMPIPDGSVTLYLSEAMPDPRTEDERSTSKFLISFESMGNKGWAVDEYGIKVHIEEIEGWLQFFWGHLQGYYVKVNSKAYDKKLRHFQAYCVHEWGTEDAPRDAFGDQIGDPYAYCNLCGVDSRRLPKIIEEMLEQEENDGTTSDDTDK